MEITIENEVRKGKEENGRVKKRKKGVHKRRLYEKMWKRKVAKKYGKGK